MAGYKKTLKILCLWLCPKDTIYKTRIPRIECVACYPLTIILQWYIYSNEINASAEVIEQKLISTLEKEQSKSCPSCMWHFYMTWYMSLPNIFKLFQTVWELWPAQDFGFRGHIKESESCHSCMWHTHRYLPMLLLCRAQLFKANDVVS